MKRTSTLIRYGFILLVTLFLGTLGYGDSNIGTTYNFSTPGKSTLNFAGTSNSVQPATGVVSITFFSNSTIPVANATCPYPVVPSMSLVLSPTASVISPASELTAVSVTTVFYNSSLEKQPTGTAPGYFTCNYFLSYQSDPKVVVNASVGAALLLWDTTSVPASPEACPSTVFGSNSYSCMVGANSPGSTVYNYLSTVNSMKANMQTPNTTVCLEDEWIYGDLASPDTYEPAVGIFLFTEAYSSSGSESDEDELRDFEDGLMGSTTAYLESGSNTVSLPNCSAGQVQLYIPPSTTATLTYYYSTPYVTYSANESGSEYPPEGQIEKWSYSYGGDLYTSQSVTVTSGVRNTINMTMNSAWKTWLGNYWCEVTYKNETYDLVEEENCATAVSGEGSTETIASPISPSSLSNATSSAYSGSVWTVTVGSSTYP